MEEFQNGVIYLVHIYLLYLIEVEANIYKIYIYLVKEYTNFLYFISIQYQMTSKH